MSRTVYSEKVPGEKVNYEWAVRFDKSTGVVGITQYTDPSGASVDRVLLTRRQVRALVAFIRPRKKATRAR